VLNMSTSSPAKRKSSDGAAGGDAKRKRDEGKSKKWSGKIKGGKKAAFDAKEKEIAHNHKEQKELKLKRKAEGNPMFEAIQEAKVHWEKARAGDCPKAERAEHITEIIALIKGKVQDVIFQHDSVRVIQCCMQYGTVEQRELIFDEMSPSILELSKSKYGKFMIPKLLTYGTKEQRGKVIKQFYGHVRKLIKHRIAAPVLAMAYIDFATSEQRSSLLQEFYGPDFTVFKMSGNQKTLQEILELHPAKKKSILKHLLATLAPLMEKGICGHHIVHRALHDYLIHAEAKDKSDMYDRIQPLLAEMIHTKDGAKCAMLALWAADAKNRKIIVRSLKPYVAKIADEEYGHSALCALFDCVDDTVLVTKQIIAPLLESLDEVWDSNYGRKVLLYLLSPRNPKYFVPETIQVLSAGDGNANSKKDAKVRQAELQKTVVPALLKHIAEQANTLVASGGASTHVVLEAVLAASAETPGLQECAVAMAATAEKGAIKDNGEQSKPLLEEETSVMANAAGHRLIQKLLAEESPVGESLASELVQQLEGKIGEWASITRASFVLMAIVNGPNADARAAVESEVKDALPALKKSESKGTVRLLELLKFVKPSAAAKAAGGKRKTADKAKAAGKKKK